MGYLMLELLKIRNQKLVCDLEKDFLLDYFGGIFYR